MKTLKAMSLKSEPRPLAQQRILHVTVFLQLLSLPGSAGLDGVELLASEQPIVHLSYKT